MWRRVKLVPFAQTFPPDRTLPDILKREGAGILAWAVRGCLDWQRDGLRHPEVVEAATQEQVCARRRMNGTCENALRMPMVEVDEAVLQAVEQHALTPEAIEGVIHLSEPTRFETTRPRPKVNARRLRDGLRTAPPQSRKTASARS